MIETWENARVREGSGEGEGTMDSLWRAAISGDGGKLTAMAARAREEGLSVEVGHLAEVVFRMGRGGSLVPLGRGFPEAVSAALEKLTDGVMTPLRRAIEDAIGGKVVDGAAEGYLKSGELEALAVCLENGGRPDFSKNVEMWVEAMVDDLSPGLSLPELVGGAVGMAGSQSACMAGMGAMFEARVAAAVDAGERERLAVLEARFEHGMVDAISRLPDGSPLKSKLRI